MTEIRVVRDPAPTVGATWCLKPLADLPEHQKFLCCLPKAHRGPCLPFGRVPLTEITDENPRYVPEPREATK